MATRIARACLGALAGGIAVATLAAPTATAAPDCSKAGIDSTVSSAMSQARSYMNSHPDGNKMLMAAASQSHDKAAQTVSAYAAANPQEYADFKAILSPVATLQQQCGVQVIPAQYQWAFEQFIN